LRYSKILNTDESIGSFIRVCEFSADLNWRLLYRASEDGFSSEMFHSKCDGLPNTLTLIRSKNENTFGGFTSVPWDTSGKYYSDKNAFIFSLTNKDNSLVIGRGGLRSAVGLIWPFVPTPIPSRRAIRTLA